MVSTVFTSATPNNIKPSSSEELSSIGAGNGFNVTEWLKNSGGMLVGGRLEGRLGAIDCERLKDDDIGNEAER